MVSYMQVKNDNVAICSYNVRGWFSRNFYAAFHTWSCTYVAISIAIQWRAVTVAVDLA